MRTTIALTTVLVLTFTTAQGQLSVTMDAADMDLDGNAIEPHIRLIADNTDGEEALTSVRFRPEIHGGILDDGRIVKWTDANNPWFGAREQVEWFVTQDSIRYSTGTVLYPDNSFAPYFSCRYQSGHDEYVDPPGGTIGDDLDLWDQSYNSFEVMDEVPAGINWDFALKLICIDGYPIELFSVAGGEVESDQGSWTLSDADRTPQSSIPEPVTLAMLIAGGAAIIARKK